VISTPADEELVRVFTTNTSYTPDEAAWAKIKAAGDVVSGWVLMGIFEDDALAEGGGPFAGSWVAFTVSP
jgi:hypothetical protein